MARQNAKAENSYAPLQEQINTLFKEIAELKAIINKDEPTEPIEEYPEFVKPQGALDAYKIGDKVTYQGKRYICKLDNCVWTPAEYPSAWEFVEEVEQETEENVEVEAE